jgi:hypothetical protein
MAKQIPDHLRYLIDDKGEVYRVQDVHEWAAEFADQHHVARDMISFMPFDVHDEPGHIAVFEAVNFTVSTVFLGVMPLKDHVGNVPFISGSYLFETIVFGADGIAVDGAKYARLDDARRGHEFILDRWRKTLGVDPAGG